MRAPDTSGARSASGASTVGIGTAYMAVVDHLITDGWHEVLMVLTPLVTVLVGVLTLYVNATALHAIKYWFAWFVIMPRERKIIEDPHATQQEKKRAREQIAQVNAELRRQDLNTIRTLEPKRTAPATAAGEAEAS